MKVNIFYSWQSDLPNSKNRNLIEACLRKAIRLLKDEIKESLTSISNFSTKCETSYLRKYNFDVYEPSIKKKI